MKLVSPTERRAELQTSETTLNVSEGIQSCSPISSERTTPLFEVEQLAATQSVTETLETAACLLADIEIFVASLRLDRNGFITLWKTPQTSESSPESKSEVDATLATCSVRVGTTTLEACYRGTPDKLTKRAVGAFLKAAAIQAERLSRRVWHYAPTQESPNDSCKAPATHKTSKLLSDKARKLDADIERVARFPHGILITGETGTGKTVSARQIYAKSVRSGNPFMELNCAAIPENLVEAELFGYRKGAFTGADRDHKGLFEEADGGILFLDEIGDIPPTIQNKLLKAIDEKQVKRLGTNQYIACDVQVIAATSRNLREMVRRGEFREDLYCRLAVLKIETVPLRERREDIPPLIDLFLYEAAETVSKLTGQREEYLIETGAVEAMCAHNWFGNIRVLHNAIYELTSYVTNGEPITMERVSALLAWMNADERDTDSVQRDGADVAPEKAGGNLYSSSQLAETLQALAQEGDIILPLEVCFLRRGETLKEWLLRVKQCGIEAAWRTSSSGKMREAATRLGLTRTNLKSQLHRTRCRLSEPRKLSSAKSE